MARIEIAREDYGKPDALQKAVARSSRQKAIDDAVAAERERCAKIADDMRIKYGDPVGDAYSNGTWDQGIRIAQKIRGLDR